MEADTITITRNTTEPLTLNFTSNGIAVNLTGSTVYFTVKSDFRNVDSEALISKTITSHSMPTAGITSLTLSTLDTDIDIGNYFYQIAIKNSLSEISRSYTGNFIVQNNLLMN